MRNFSNFKSGGLILALIIVMVFSISIYKDASAKTVCTSITKSLNYNAKKLMKDKEVTMLQDFLYTNGYLASKTTGGSYGKLTYAAVKKFQIAQKISPTGSIGPITRAAIKKISCSNTPTTATPTPTIVTTTTPIAPVVKSTVAVVPTPVFKSVNSFSAPTLGAEVTTGNTFMIKWTGDNTGRVINILIEDGNGAGAGYIATNQSNINQYIWTVGKIFMSDEQYTTASPGKYRIVIVDQLSNNSILNIKSDLFTIKETPLAITNIMPATAINDAKTEVMLYGNGFNSLTKVKLEGIYNKLSVIPQYFSPNGKLLWFYIPQYVNPDTYSVYAYNDYTSVDSTLINTPSNIVSLNIVKQ